MSMTAPKDITEIFGPVIAAITRADLIEEGALIPADPDKARDARLIFPVAFTAAAHTKCVAWDDKDTQRTGVYQDQGGREWDVLFQAGRAFRAFCAKHPTISLQEVHRIPLRVALVPRDLPPSRLREEDILDVVHLVLTIGPGDDGEPVLTIMLPNED